MVNELRFKGGINMNINDYKIIYVASPYDGDEKQITVVENLISELIKDDLKNNRNYIIYISPLKTFGWLEGIVSKEEILNYNLKLLTLSDEVYVLPDYELDKSVNQCIGMAKHLGICITYL